MSARNDQKVENKNRSESRIQSLIERMLFRFRPAILVLFALITVVLGYHASQLSPSASFEKMVPTEHPYIANYLKYQDDLRADSNAIRIIVTNKTGSIYEADYLEALRQITDEAFFIPGTDRGNMMSLWTPNVIYREATEQGWDAGTIIPSTYDGSAAALDQVRQNVQRSGRIGSLVANDFSSSIILIPLLERDPQTGERLDYGDFSNALEALIRDKYSSDEIDIHIIGFAKIIGDLIEGASNIAMFFALTFVLTAFLLLVFSRCWRSTGMALLAATTAVVWQLGLVRLLGYGLDPYTILIPFLTFAIAVSHAVQNINTMGGQVNAGASPTDAAKRTFRLLFIPGSVALLLDAVGFITLMVVKIEVIQELALTASVGVAVVIITNMLLLTVLMSYVGISRAGVRHQEKKATAGHPVMNQLSRLTEPKVALVAVLIAAVGLSTAFYYRAGLQVGDLHSGAAELRADSRYNLDNAYLVSNYSTSTDVFTVMFETPHDECGTYQAAVLGDRFGGQMANVPGVAGMESLYGHAKHAIAGSNEGNPKWHQISRNQFVLNTAVEWSPSGAYNFDCTMAPIKLYLSDQRAETLLGVVEAAERYSKENSTEELRFVLAAGNAGIQAATNEVVTRSQPLILALIFGIVGIMVFWEFKSWRVTLAIIIPLFITSMLAEALMAVLGLGLKVATLPVVALGVGIGVDYGIYIYSKLQYYLDRGQGLREAYYNTLRTTGVAVAFTGVTLALGTFTWIFSTIQFQADMGLLLTFMFLWNMIGAVLLLPAIASLLMPHLREAREPLQGTADVAGA